MRDFRAARAKIGLVPQELDHRHVRDGVEHAHSSAAGCSASRAIRPFIEKVLRDLSLWDKKDSKIMTLSGGMKRRVMIAKALSHEPTILFLDEPSAGVDVELRRDMWEMVRGLRERGVTIILTTHYIEEAEEMADRIGVISKGELDRGRGEDRADAQAGQEAAHAAPAERRWPRFPPALAGLPLELAKDGTELIYTFDTQASRNRHRRRCCASSTSRASSSRTCTPRRARSRTSS